MHPFPEVAADADKSANIIQSRLRNVHAAVEIFGPAYGQIKDAVTKLFRDDQQFRVKKPSGILDLGKKPLRRRCGDGFKTALRVGKPGEKKCFHQKVVRA